MKFYEINKNDVNLYPMLNIGEIEIGIRIHKNIRENIGKLFLPIIKVVK